VLAGMLPDPDPQVALDSLSGRHPSTPPSSCLLPLNSALTENSFHMEFVAVLLIRVLPAARRAIQPWVFIWPRSASTRLPARLLVHSASHWAMLCFLCNLQAAAHGIDRATHFNGSHVRTQPIESTHWKLNWCIVRHLAVL
jgi:hypothetical protein